MRSEPLRARARSKKPCGKFSGDRPQGRAAADRGMLDSLRDAVSSRFHHGYTEALPTSPTRGSRRMDGATPVEDTFSSARNPTGTHPPRDGGALGAPSPVDGARSDLGSPFPTYGRRPRIAPPPTGPLYRQPARAGWSRASGLPAGGGRVEKAPYPGRGSSKERARADGAELCETTFARQGRDVRNPDSVRHPGGRCGHPDGRRDGCVEQRRPRSSGHLIPRSPLR